MAPTSRGAGTRERIVAATAELMAVRGVAGTSLDAVREVTCTSKSQLYHYFAGKADLVRAVVAHSAAAMLAVQRLEDDPPRSWEALQRWRYRVLAAHRGRPAGVASPLGSIAAELSGSDRAEDAAGAAEARTAFDQWRFRLEQGLATMREEGALRPEADPAQLATCLVAAVEGGSLLAAVQGSSAPLRDALDGALAWVAGFMTGQASRRAPSAPPPAG